MDNPKHRRMVALALVTLCLDCSRSGQNEPLAQNESQAARATTSKSPPTNDWSFQLLFKDDPTRFSIMQTLFVQSAKRCSMVTKASFEAGLDGTDEWQVVCADSGAWRVWFKPEGRIDFDSCDKNECE